MKKLKKMITTNKKGFTLVELLLVVGFVTIVSLGVYTVYSKVAASNQANMESRNLDTLRAGIANLYATSPSFDGLDVKVVNQARITPDHMVTGSNRDKIVNSFGQEVTIAPTSLGGGTNNAFKIGYKAVPPEVCVKLVTAGGSQFNRVVVGSVEVKKFNENVNAGTAAAECNKAGSGGAIIEFEALK